MATKWQNKRSKQLSHVPGLHKLNRLNKSHECQATSKLVLPIQFEIRTQTIDLQGPRLFKLDLHLLDDKCFTSAQQIVYVLQVNDSNMLISDI